MTALVKARTLAELIARGAPQVFTSTTKAWREKLVAWFETDESGPKRKLYPGQFEMLLIEMLSFALALLGQEAQIAVEQRWLAFATGKHLELMAANNSTFRLLASPAVTTLEFQLQDPAGGLIIIPEGTQVEAGDKHVFATDADLEIAIGETTGSVTATALEAGLASNGYAPGQVSELLDDLPEEFTVTNLDETTGGSVEETDDALRMRAANAHDRISKAGPRESYRQQVRSFSPAIIDVAVTRPEPGDINIYPLLESGAPDLTFRDNLLSYMDYETKRPQGDDVFVLAPEAVTFAIEATVRADGDLALIETEVTAALETAAAIWSRRLGDYLALSALTCAAKQVSGVVDIDVTVTGLADRQLLEYQFAALTGVTLTMEAA